MLQPELLLTNYEKMQRLTNTIKAHKKAWLLSLLSFAILATLLLAISLPRLELAPGEDIPLAGILELLSGDSSSLVRSEFYLSFNLVRLLIACLWILIIASVIGFIISSEIRKLVFKRIIQYTFWILVFYGLVITIAPYIPRNFKEDAGPTDTLIGVPQSDELFPSPPEFVINPPPWIVYLVTGIMIVLLLGLAWFIWYVFIRAEKTNSPLEELTQEAQHALDNIQAGHNLKDAIRQCYADMSHILKQQRNIKRAQGMTPREFEQHLAASGFKTEDIKRLTRLFERVRYGSKESGPKEEQEAVACLNAIIHTYGSTS